MAWLDWNALVPMAAIIMNAAQVVARATPRVGRPMEARPSRRYHIGPPETVPSAWTLRNFTAIVHSAIFVDMPTNPATNIQKAAPGPPIVMATATPAMLPSPTVLDNAVANAWKWVTSPVASAGVYLPRTRSRACFMPRTLRNFSQRVKNVPQTTSQPTMSGTSVPKIGTA